MTAVTTSSSSAPSAADDDAAHDADGGDIVKRGTRRASPLSLLVDRFLTSVLPEAWSAPRRGTLTCPCGAVQFDIYVPPSSHAIVEQTNAVCHCNHCVGFARACPNGGAVINDNNGTHLVNFYKSDLTLVRGRDAIRAVRLFDGSPMVRTYCGKCGTPLGADLRDVPITLLYEPLLRYSVVFLPTVVLAFREAEAGTRRYVRTVAVRSRNYGPVFLWRVIQRILLGLALGKKGEGMLDNNFDGVPIGLETISADAGAAADAVSPSSSSSKPKDQ